MIGFKIRLSRETIKIWVVINWDTSLFTWQWLQSGQAEVDQGPADGDRLISMRMGPLNISIYLFAEKAVYNVKIMETMNLVRAAVVAHELM